MNSTSHHTISLYTGVMVLFVLLRWATGGFDFSYFIVAGTQSCDPAVVPIAVQPGYSFDGVYYYRYALAPFSTENPYSGITVSTPAYRHQRIFYPVVTWLLSFGGLTSLVPLLLVVVNMIFFTIYLVGCHKLIKRLDMPPRYLLLALLIPGVWMALARDLAEVTELCLFVYVLLACLGNHKILFIGVGTAMMFTRETSAITLAAFGLQQLTAYLKNDRKRDHLAWLGCVCVPIVLFVGYKCWLLSRYGNRTDIGMFNLSLIPFVGWWEGWMAQWKGIYNSGARGALVFCFSLAHFAMMGWAWIQALGSQPHSTPVHQWMQRCIWLWMLFAPFLGWRIWETDWGFARALSIPFFCALFLSASANRLPNSYLMAGAGLQLLLLIRLIVKV